MRFFLLLTKNNVENTLNSALSLLFLTLFAPKSVFIRLYSFPRLPSHSPSIVYLSLRERAYIIYKI